MSFQKKSQEGIGVLLKLCRRVSTHILYKFIIQLFTRFHVSCLDLGAHL